MCSGVINVIFVFFFIFFLFFFFFQAEDGIRDLYVTGVQTCALPILGQPLCAVTIRRFADGEIFVKIDENVRGRDVFIIQPTNPPAENYLELLFWFAISLALIATRG